MQNKNHKYFVIGLLLFAVSFIAAAQTNFIIPYRAEVATGVREKLFTGVHPNATYCIDVGIMLNFDDGTRLIEEELPPPPPDPVDFDLRLKDSRSGLGGCFGNGLRTDIRAYSIPERIDTFIVNYRSTLENAEGHPIKFYWPVGINLVCDSIKITTPTEARRRMDTTTFVVLSDPELNLMRIIKYGSKPYPALPPLKALTYTPVKDSVLKVVTPELIWSFVQSAISYNYQIALDENFTSTLIDDSTKNYQVIKQVVLHNYNKKHYWRVRARNQYGYGPFSNTNSFITPPLPVPTLVSPDSIANNLPRPINFRWRKPVAIPRYHLQIANDVNFTQVVINDTAIIDTFRQISLIPSGRTYFWRVRCFADGEYGIFSSSRTFGLRLYKPAVPELVLPAHRDTGIAPVTNFRWRQTLDAVQYHLQISSDTNITSIIFQDSTITDTTRTINLSPLTTYFWRVRAKNDSGITNSAVWRFRTRIPVPSTTILVAPGNNDTSALLSPTLTWNSTQYASQYELEVALDNNFTNKIYTNTNLVDTSEQIPTLISYIQYYWRVRAKNYVGTGQYSSVWNFKTVLTPPEIVTLISPLNNQINVIANPTVQWSSSIRGVGYHYQIDTVITFAEPLFEDSSYSGLSKQIGPLGLEKKYYWRVRSWNRTGYGDYSNTFNFTTVGFPIPDSVILKEPRDKAPNISLRPTLQWEPALNAEFYFLEVARDSIFSLANRVLLDTTITTNERKIGLLSEQTRYFWRVKAKNKGGISGWSQVWSFKTYGDESASWLTSFVVFETGIARDTIRFGVHPNATHGIDNALGEYMLPPVEPGYFDARWVSPPRRSGILGEGIRLNYIPFTSFTQIDTYRVSFQTGIGTYPVTIRWNNAFLKNVCDSIKLRDEIGGFTVNVRMDLDNSVQITNEAVKTLSLTKWGARPLNVKIESNQIPDDFVLYQNYPNPFNPSTNIRFSIKNSTRAALIIYNTLGECITTLTDNYFVSGTYSVEWHSKDMNSQNVPSGVYFIKMNTDKYSVVQKMILIR
ncbi:MAG: T9SS type A sorting domain-containing protein [Bacteroidota bacterium]|nr:T9SS type A sorting domain-containing protein [Bacteroidota bacterium]